MAELADKPMIDEYFAAYLSELIPQISARIKEAVSSDFCEKARPGNCPPAEDHNRELVHELRVLIRRYLSVSEALKPFVRLKSGRKLSSLLSLIRKSAAGVRDYDIAASLLEQMIIQDPSAAADRQLKADLAVLAGKFKNKYCKSRQLFAQKLPGLSDKNERIEIVVSKIKYSYPIAESGLAVLYPLAASICAASRHLHCLRAVNEGGLDRTMTGNMHEIRKMIRNFRYLIEFFPGTKITLLQQRLAQCKAIQDMIGSWHDLSVILRYAKKYADAGIITQPTADYLGGLTTAGFSSAADAISRLDMNWFKSTIKLTAPVDI